jgi:hypothetical protein
MRRFIVLVLLVLLPLQFAAAAASAYCADEKPSAPSHLGHHECAQAASDNAVGEKTDQENANGDKAAAEGDCGICHTASAHLLAFESVAGIPDLSLPPIIPFLHPAPQHAPEPSDRPPISPAA